MSIFLCIFFFKQAADFAKVISHEPDLLVRSWSPSPTVMTSIKIITQEKVQPDLYAQ